MPATIHTRPNPERDRMRRHRIRRHFRLWKESWRCQTCGGSICDYYESPLSPIPLPLKAMAAAGRSIDKIIQTAQSGYCLCDECKQTAIGKVHHAKQEPRMTHNNTITVTATEAAEALFRNHVEPGVQAMTPTDAIEYLEAIIELATEMLYSDSEGDNTELPNPLEFSGE